MRKSKEITFSKLTEDISIDNDLGLATAALIVEKLVSAGLLERYIRVNGYQYPDTLCLPDDTKIEDVEIVFTESLK